MAKKRRDLCAAVVAIVTSVFSISPLLNERGC